MDQKFNRARYDADQTVAAFAGCLQDAVVLEANHCDLTGAVTGALEPAHVSVSRRRAARRDAGPGEARRTMMANERARECA